MSSYVIRERDGVYSNNVEDRDAFATDPDDLLIEVEYSGVNYKDALVASPRSRVRRAEELVGGVDAAGVVASSTNPLYPVGSRVAVHGEDLGVARDGGYAPRLFAPARLVNVLPASISTRDAMVIGTAGFTAMASLLALEHYGLKRDGEVARHRGNGRCWFTRGVISQRARLPTSSVHRIRSGHRVVARARRVASDWSRRHRRFTRTRTRHAAMGRRH